MKQEEKLMKALTGIDDRYIQESESSPLSHRLTRKGHARIIAIASAACLCCAGIILGSVLLLHRSGDLVWETKIVSGYITEPDEIYQIPHWDEMRLYQQFPEAEFNGRTYVASSYHQSEQEMFRDNALVQSLIGKFIGNAELHGYDIYTETAFTQSAQLYGISGMDPVCAIAVRFEGQEEYYPYLCHEYRPDTLEDFVHALNLKNTLTLTGSAYCDYQKSHGSYAHLEFVGLKSETVWQMLLSDLSSVNEAKEGFHWNHTTVMTFGVSIPSLAIENLSMGVTEDGYLVTNLLATEKAFYIGADRTKAFVDYVKSNLKGYELIYMDADHDPENHVEDQTVMGTTCKTAETDPIFP